MDRKDVNEVFQRFSNTVFKKLKDHCADYVEVKHHTIVEKDDDITCKLSTKISKGGVVFRHEMNLSLDAIMKYEISGVNVGITILNAYRSFITDYFYCG